MPKQKPILKRALLVRIAVSVAVLAAAVYVLATHWNTMLHAVRLARTASIRWLVPSLLLMASTFCVAAGIYGLLALHGLRLFQTVLVEVAAAFVNRLLPAGLGGLGLHGLYLYKRKHTAAEATVVVSVNNLLGIVAHMLLLAAVVVFEPNVLHKFTEGHFMSARYVFACVVIMILVLLWAPVRKRVAVFADHLLASIRRLSPRKLFPALLFAMLLTAVYTSVLFTVTRSLGISLNVLQAFIIFSLGMLTQTATPTPGGLVGAEAGLFAGFVAYGVADSPAAAAVLLYRLITYWFPLIPGALALFFARQRKLV